MNKVYKPLDLLSDADINEILNGDDIGKIIRLPLSVGMNHSNWKFAQDLCVKLSEHYDARVRANSIMSLAYIAKTKGKLDFQMVFQVRLLTCQR